MFCHFGKVSSKAAPAEKKKKVATGALASHDTIHIDVPEMTAQPDDFLGTDPLDLGFEEAASDKVVAADAGSGSKSNRADNNPSPTEPGSQPSAGEKSTGPLFFRNLAKFLSNVMSRQPSWNVWRLARKRMRCA